MICYDDDLNANLSLGCGKHRNIVGFVLALGGRMMLHSERTRRI